MHMPDRRNSCRYLLPSERFVAGLNSMLNFSNISLRGSSFFLPRIASALPNCSMKDFLNYNWFNENGMKHWLVNYSITVSLLRFDLILALRYDLLIIRGPVKIPISCNLSARAELSALSAPHKARGALRNLLRDNLSKQPVRHLDINTMPVRCPTSKSWWFVE